MKASQEVAEGHGPDILQSLLGYALFSAPKEKKNLQWQWTNHWMTMSACCIPCLGAFRYSQGLPMLQMVDDKPQDQNLGL